MRTKFIVFSDFHWHNFENFAKPVTYTYKGKEIQITDRLLAQLNTINRVFEIAHENDADVLFDGDYFHARNRITTLVYNLGFNAIYDNMMKYPDVKLYMIVGNHDQADSSDFPEHSLENFKAIPRVVVMDDFKPAYTGSCMLYPISYSDNVEFIKGKIDEFARHAKDEDEPTILMAHIGVDGSETGQHSHRLGGAFNISELYPNVFTYVTLGHYHKRQFLGGTDNVFYVGNTIPESFSDEGQDKGVFLIDLAKGGKPEFIPIENKKFITLKGVDENTQEIVDNNYIRFIIPQELATEIEVFKESSDTIRVEVQKEYKADLRIDIEVGSSEADIVKEYTNKFYTNVQDKALAVLREAQTLNV
ncbi:phosphoesterase [Bacillus phage Spock]|uniref:Phosphoesterase n=1 Tax=Bacillus phage Spock TaxID=1406791 RepID=U5PX07_9CAUD|nr:phosphoesterase [Bacillus phage Spock]AGY48510.1 phosphoesterase [Bacillus phage Spock]